MNLRIEREETPPHEAKQNQCGFGSLCATSFDSGISGRILTGPLVLDPDPVSTLGKWKRQQMSTIIFSSK